MLGLRLMRLVEAHSEELAAGLTEKLRKAERTCDFRRIPPEDLHPRAAEVYHNLGVWLLTKTEDDIEKRFKAIGARAGLPMECRRLFNELLFLRLDFTCQRPR
jgi:hypothetical protein